MYVDQTFNTFKRMGTVPSTSSQDPREILETAADGPFAVHSVPPWYSGYEDCTYVGIHTRSSVDTL